MPVIENTAIVLLVVLVFGLIIPEFFRKFKLPYISLLILFGALAGPNGMGYFQSNETIEFFGFLGSAFLMLMAGLEVKIKHLQNLKKKIGVMAFMNGAIPFAVGIFITKAFGYSWLTSLLVGTIFISSSVAIVASSLRQAGIENKKIGEAILSSTVIEDITSLFLLAIILQTVAPVTRLPLPLYFGILVASVFVLKRLVPPFGKYYLKHIKKNHSKSEEDQIHFVVALLIGVLLFFSGLGVHPIVAAFVVGILLSDFITSKTLIEKIHTIGYGIFVPMFFFVVGLHIDLSLFTQFDITNFLMISLVLGLILAKFVSGYFSARWVKFSKHNASLFGVVSTAQLTTTLAVAYAAATLNILDSALLTSVVVIAILTTIISPIVLNYISGKKK
jgi:Kef-type K+ transport system membrane component KefB